MATVRISVALLSGEGLLTDVNARPDDTMAVLKGLAELSYGKPILHLVCPNGMALQE